MKRIWIKLFIELLDDPKMGRLPDWLWRRAIELFLLAGENGNDGLLPPVEDMAWRLRISGEKLTEALQALSQVGVVHESPDGWMVTHFKERQYSESYERVKRYRERYSNAKSNEDETEVESSSPLDSDSEGGGVGEGVPIPETPADAMKHPDIQAFQAICSRIPGARDYGLVISTIRLLRAKHGAALTEKVQPYWLAWSGRRNKQGNPYDPASLVWLTEWAVNETIPVVNGSMPDAKPAINEQAVESTRKMLDKKYSQPFSPPPPGLRPEQEIKKLAEKKGVRK